MRYTILFISVLLILSCKKDDPKPPSAALLTFPLQNSECTTGVDLNENTSRVEFTWMKADNTTTYELRVTNITLNITQTISTEALSASLPLAKGTPYSWVVISRNTATQETATSATWQFYNAGAQTTFAPFPAQAITPTSGSTAVIDMNNEVALEWSAADVDNDIAGFEISFGTDNPPQQLVASPSVGITSVKVSVQTGTTYYWEVLTRDNEGNTSKSGVFTFKTL
ncbi:MAG: hypothetical protein AB3N14_18350 [Flavobacteriaceae bacterium]